MNEEHISLKWGTLKAWELHSDKSLSLLREYFDGGVSMSSALQKDSKNQKEKLCRLIDVCNAEEIHLDWDDKYVTKDEAKKYIMEGQ